ncbi:MAG: hypothetical protein OXE86_02755, partial [Alphaproteobacteria bacterium]|nr:hypothetical protein [Alphaproteobacteria bacterium]
GTAPAPSMSAASSTPGDLCRCETGQDRRAVSDPAASRALQFQDPDRRRRFPAEVDPPHLGHREVAVHVGPAGVGMGSLDFDRHL